MNKASTRKIIDVNKDKCVNCHQCISVCPSKLCNDGSKSYVEVNPELCIGCGACIKVCTHEARIGLDDFSSFLSAAEHREPIVAVVAPSIVSNFPDTYLNINGWLQSLGIKAVFDVSFGAELTVKTYLHALQDKNLKHIISQPCPAIVNYIELYRPELLPYLAPADSPMMHTMKMIKEFYPEYKNAQFAVLSPCYAKRREFDEVGIGDYNITFKSLDAYFSKQKINLNKFQSVPYTNPPAERGVLFSNPGGLLRTAQREVPGIEAKTRKIEGQHSIYKYLDTFIKPIKDNTAPLLLDCLNCELGCNAGPGTLNLDKSIDEVENPIEKRCYDAKKAYVKREGKRASHIAKKKINKILSKYWKDGLYDRTYVNRNSIVKTFTKIPSQSELNIIYESMYKIKKDDFLDCCSCGYNSCTQMAIAVFNGVNKPENCRHYQEIKILRNEKEALHKSDVLMQLMADISTSIEKIHVNIQNLNESIENQSEHVTESSAAVKQMIVSITNITSSLISNSDELSRLSKTSETSIHNIQNIAQDVTKVAEDSKLLFEITNTIDDIANRTALLSMNAAIEAAHAGNSGRGFAVVADEIRKLAESSSSNAKSITTRVNTIVQSITKISELIQLLNNNFIQINSNMHSIDSQEQSMKNGLMEQTIGNDQLNESLHHLQSISMSIKQASYSVLEQCTQITDELAEIKKTEAVEQAR